MRLFGDKKTQISQTVAVGVLLATVGGFLDAYTYILRGKVFANAQTGNIVFLGIRLAEGSFNEILRYLAPIAAFVLGVVIVELIRKRFRYAPSLHWRQIVIALEILVLIGVGFVPNGKYDIYVNVAISFVCSMQVESFRLLNGKSYATTMCTGNLRAATEQLFRYSIKKDKNARSLSLQYILIIVFFIVGAVCGTIFSKLLNEYAVFITCGLLLVVFFMMFIRKKEELNETTLTKNSEHNDTTVESEQSLAETITADASAGDNEVNCDESIVGENDLNDN